MDNKKMMSIAAARNGWTIKTRSGIYICTTIAQLLDEVKSMALVMQKEQLPHNCYTAGCRDQHGISRKIPDAAKEKY